MNIKLFAVTLLLFTSLAVATNTTTWNGTAGAVILWTLDTADTPGSVATDRGVIPTNGAIAGTQDVAAQWAEGVTTTSTTGHIDNLTITGAYPHKSYDTGFSFNIWFKAASDSNGNIFGFGDYGDAGGWVGVAQYGGTWYFDIGDNPHLRPNSVADITTGTWHMVTYVWNATSDNLTGYFDNAVVATGTYAESGAIPVGNNLGIGAFYRDGVGYSQPSMTAMTTDAFSYYNYTLSTAEISNLFNYNYVGVTSVSYVTAYGTIADTYTTPVYETRDTPFNFSIWVNTTNITAASAGLSWNGTTYAPSSSGGSTVGDNTTYWWAYENFTTPLVATNYTNITTYWNYNLTWVNATTTPHTGTSHTQAIYQAYYWGDYYPDTSLLWGDTLDFNANFTNLLGLAAYNLWADFDGTDYPLAGAANPYTGSVAAPEPSGTSESWASNATLNVSFTSDEVGYTIYERLSENETITIYKAAIVACDGVLGNLTTINFTFYDEEDVSAPVNSNMDLTVWVYPDLAHTANTTASFNFTDTINATLCIYPSWATVYVDSWQTYWGNETYNQLPRAYFLNDAILTNVTEEVNLYVLNDSLSMLMSVAITDSDSAPITGALVYFARYYPAENVYRTVAMILTDDFGEGSTYLRPNDIWYRFTIAQDSTTVGVFSPQTISCNPAGTICELYLTLAPGTWLEFTEYYDKFSYACAFNATGTNATVCSYADTSGLMKYARLQVWQAGLFSPTQICDTTLTTVSGSLSCVLGNVAGLYTYTLSAHFADEITLYTGEIDTVGATGALFGTTGIIAAAFVFILAAMAGAHSAGAVLIMGSVGLISAQLLGLLGLAPSAIVAFVVVAFALFIKIRGGGK